MGLVNATANSPRLAGVGLGMAGNVMAGAGEFVFDDSFLDPCVRGAAGSEAANVDDWKNAGKTVISNSASQWHAGCTPRRRGAKGMTTFAIMAGNIRRTVPEIQSDVEQWLMP